MKLVRKGKVKDTKRQSRWGSEGMGGGLPRAHNHHSSDAVLEGREDAITMHVNKRLAEIKCTKTTTS